MSNKPSPIETHWLDLDLTSEKPNAPFIDWTNSLSPNSLLTKTSVFSSPSTMYSDSLSNLDEPMEQNQHRVAIAVSPDTLLHAMLESMSPCENTLEPFSPISLLQFMIDTIDRVPPPSPPPPTPSGLPLTSLLSVNASTRNLQIT